MIDEQCLRIERSGILYDASTLRKPLEEMFSPDYWRSRNALSETAGGRGSIAVLHGEQGEWVLRHYRRGGWASKISRDSYLWTGAERTRCFREWRLLAELWRRSLPVPRPVAARYIRSGLLYRADLITERLANARTLAEMICGAPLSQAEWRAVGSTVATFHANGVHHRDLNARNILFADASSDRRVYVLDFDRGTLRSRGTWEDGVLARLHRSLEKLRSQRSDVRFDELAWEWLLEGYRMSLTTSA